MLSQLDLDTMLSGAKADDPHGYFKEAVVNYRSESYRSCVVSTYNAVFSDIFEKLRNLVEVNGKNRNIFDNANRLRKARQPYEHNLAEELFKAELISEEQRVYLDDLRRQRNDAAHPIGGEWPAGMAVYLLTDAVRLFLSQESLSPNMVMDQLVSRLRGDNCFPSGNRSSQNTIVSAEIARVVSTAYHILMKRLLELWNGDEEPLRKHTGIFVREALSLRNSELRTAILAQFVRPILNRLHEEDSRLLVSMILSTPNWIRELDATSQTQVDLMLHRYVEDEPKHTAARLFERIHKRAPSLFDNVLKGTLRAIVTENATDPRLFAVLTRPGAAREQLISRYRLEALGRGRAEMLAFLRDNGHAIADRLSGLESYALLLATSGLERRGFDEIEGFDALLLGRATTWYERDRCAAKQEALRGGMHDPALWFADASPDSITSRVV